MENRELVIADYFELRLLLNRTNSVRNKNTDIRILPIKKGPADYSLVATLIGIQNPKHIELCKMNRAGRWIPGENSGLLELEEFCANFLRKSLKQNFSFNDLEIASEMLHRELRNLGIPR